MLTINKANYSFVLAVFIFLLFQVVTGFAQNDKKAVEGIWMVEDKDAKVKIYPCADGYCGKIIWLEEPRTDSGKIRTDENNPDPELRDRTLKGLKILSGLEYSGDKVWEDGEIYDPENGKTYSCYVEIQENGKLEVRGYIGFSLVGRSEMWQKTQRN